MGEIESIECNEHGKAFETFVCFHLISRESKDWYSRKPDEESLWPDAWCGICHKFYLEEGEWNDTSSQAASLNVKLLCHYCYERFRSECAVHFIE